MPMHFRIVYPVKELRMVNSQCFIFTFISVKAFIWLKLQRILYILQHKLSLKHLGLELNY